jgi:16S rRNA (uracil1498-N3)-methyltransferase
MKMHRFYVAEKRLSQISPGGVFDVVDDALMNQLKRVFRFHVGDSIIIFDGDGQDHGCLIKEFLKDKIILQINRSFPSRFMPDREIWLCAAIIKKDKFEWIVEKATELGVSHIVPILSERSEKKSLNMERLQKIAAEASEQSGRGNVPIIHSIIELEKSIKYIKKIPNSKSQVPNNNQTSIINNQTETASSVQMLVFHTEGESVQGEALYKDKIVALFIGPEGGWSEREVELFHKENVPVKSLGKQVLRAETAAVAVLAQFVF